MASLVKLALFTGMRRSALLNLRWDDLDFERGYITLRGAVAKKGKTDTIPMNDQARMILSGIPHYGSPYVFPGKDPSKPRANISGFLNDIREKPDYRKTSVPCMACVTPLLRGLPAPVRSPCTNSRS